MKQRLLILVGICLISLASCQKKQYAHFQIGLQTQYAQETQKAVTKTNIAAAETKSEEINMVTAPAEVLSAGNSENVITEADLTTTEVKGGSTVETKTIAPGSAVKKKMTFIQKVKAINQLKKFSKEVSKQTKTTAKAKSADPDTLALISLIAGIASIILLFASGVLGLLLGLTALILGLLSLRTTNKRGMAIVGTLLGALTLLIFLIAIIFVAAFIAAA